MDTKISKEMKELLSLTFDDLCPDMINFYNMLPFEKHYYICEIRERLRAFKEADKYKFAFPEDVPSPICHLLIEELDPQWRKSERYQKLKEVLKASKKRVGRTK